MGFYPIGNCLMTDRERSRNAALVHAIDIQPQRFLPYCFCIAPHARFRGVFPAACFADVALASRCIVPDFYLLFRSLTVRTFYHAPTLPYPPPLPLPHDLFLPQSPETNTLLDSD